MSRFIGYSLIIGLATGLLLLGGCGGSQPAPADTTPPSLTGHTPADGAVGVDLGEPITLVFSEAIDPGSVTAASVRVLDGGGELTYDHSLSSDGKTLSLNLTSRPATSPATLEVRLSGVKDRAGNAMGAASFSFTSADEAAPTLLSHTPDDGATGVMLADAITLTFSEPMDPASITAASVRVLDGASELAYDHSLDASGTTLTLKLTAAPAALPASLSVSLDGLTDLAGNPLAAGGFSFETADDWVRMGGELDESSSAYTTIPVIASAGGDVYVAFMEGGAVYVKAWQAGSETWEPLGGQVVSSGALFLDMDLDPDGVPVLACRQGDGIYVFRWNGSAWEQQGDTISEGASLNYIDLDVGAGGQMAVTWWKYENPKWRLYVAYRASSSASWGPLGASYEVGEAINESDVAVDPSGNVYYAIVTASGAAVMKWNGSSWNQLGAAINHGSYPSKHHLAAGPGGELYYSGYFGGAAWVDRWDSGSSSWENLGGSLTSGSDSSWPIRIITDSSGNPLLLYYRNSGAKEMYAATWDASASAWDSFGPAVFDTGNEETYGRASIGYDANDLPLVAWRFDSDTYYHVYVSRYNGLAR